MKVDQDEQLDKMGALIDLAMEEIEVPHPASGKCVHMARYHLN